MPDPKITMKDPKELKVVTRMAEQARQDIIDRAFPQKKRAGRSLQGKAFKKLSPGYRLWKRSKGRPGVPDQRFTSVTANALRARLASKNSARLGFVQNRIIAGYLERRNKYWGLTKKEQKRVLDIAAREGARSAASVRVKDGQIIVEVGIAVRKK
jgi:hypothetical protein